MSIIETLTEGIVNRDMKKEGSALLSKWGKTGLLEGLQTEHEKSTMARLLENQAKELLRESNYNGWWRRRRFRCCCIPNRSSCIRRTYRKPIG